MTTGPDGYFVFGQRVNERNNNNNHEQKLGNHGDERIEGLASVQMLPVRQWEEPGQTNPYGHIDLIFMRGTTTTETTAAVMGHLKRSQRQWRGDRPLLFRVFNWRVVRSTICHHSVFRIIYRGYGQMFFTIFAAPVTQSMCQVRRCAFAARPALVGQRQRRTFGHRLFFHLMRHKTN